MDFAIGAPRRLMRERERRHFHCTAGAPWEAACSLWWRPGVFAAIEHSRFSRFSEPQSGYSRAQSPEQEEVKRPSFPVQLAAVSSSGSRSACCCQFHELRKSASKCFKPSISDISEMWIPHFLHPRNPADHVFLIFFSLGIRRAREKEGKRIISRR